MYVPMLSDMNSRLRSHCLMPSAYIENSLLELLQPIFRVLPYLNTIGPKIHRPNTTYAGYWEAYVKDIT
jgi:hypothetical protein